MFDDLLHGEVDLLLRGKAAQAEAYARMGKILLHSNGPQHVGGFEGGGGAGTGAQKQWKKYKQGEHHAQVVPGISETSREE